MVSGKSCTTYVVHTAIPLLLDSPSFYFDTSSRHPDHSHIFTTSCCSTSSDLAPCSLWEKYRALQGMLFVLCTIMGMAWGMIIYICLFLCSSHVQRDRWIDITNNWSSLLLCYVFSVILSPHFQCSLNVICIFHAFIIKPLQCVLLLSLRLPHIWK